MRSPLNSISLRLLIAAIFLGVNFLIQQFWFRRAWNLTAKISNAVVRRLSRALWFAAMALVVLAVLSAVPALRHPLPRQNGLIWLLAAVKLWLGTSFFALVGIKAVKWIGRFWKALSPAPAPSQLETLDAGRRAFIRRTAYLVGSVPFVAGAYGFARERFDYRILGIRIHVRNWPAALDGFTIAQLSDIHASDFMTRDEIHRAVGMANDLHADLAVVTGDFITGRNDPLAACIAELSRLRAPLGVWGCNGNHEIYADAEAKAQLLFEQHGMRLLRQQNAEIDYRGAKFNLIGVDYQRERSYSGRKLEMLRGIEPLVRSGIPNILLSHNPNSFRRAAEVGIELSLAGHTHGGQVQVEILDHSLSPARFMTPFIAGLYRLPFGAEAATAGALETTASDSSALYVNRGLGTIGMPVRLGVPPEITRITLLSA